MCQAVQEQAWRRLVDSFPLIPGLCQAFLSEGGEQMGFECHELRRGEHLEAARSGEIDVLRQLHLPWPRRHDIHTVRQEDGLVDVVGHEHNGLMEGFP